MDKNKKRAIRILAVFLAVMALCTVISRAAASMLVAQVQVEKIKGTPDLHLGRERADRTGTGDKTFSLAPTAGRECRKGRQYGKSRRMSGTVQGGISPKNH